MKPEARSALLQRQNSYSEIEASYEQSGLCMYYYADRRPNWAKGLQPCIKYCENNGGHGYSECDLSTYKDTDMSKIDPSTVEKDDEGYLWVPARCKCDNPTVEAVATDIFNVVAEGLQMLDNIICVAMLSAFKTIVEIGIDFVPGGAELNGAKSAVEGAKSFVENGLQAADFFDNWIGDACGVPDWNFDLWNSLVVAPDSFGVSIGCKKKNKADCKKVPDPTTKKDNPKPTKTPDKPTKTPAKPTETPDKPTKTPDKSSKSTGGPKASMTSHTATPTPTAQCDLKRANVKNPKKVGTNGVQSIECNNGATTTHKYIITSLSYAANAQATQVQATCSKRWSQACYHYSSAIREHQAWSTLTCPQEAATKTRSRINAGATGVWNIQHSGDGWKDENYRAHQACQVDEYPPVYLLRNTDTAFTRAGVDTTGQSVRWLPGSQNGGAASMWTQICFKTPIKALDDNGLWNAAHNQNFGLTRAVKAPKSPGLDHNANVSPLLAASTEYTVGITVAHKPEFTIAHWEHDQTAKDDGLWDNPCWPKKIAPKDPGFTLLTFDTFYKGQKPPYDYTAKYVQGTNGAKRDLDMLELGSGVGDNGNVTVSN
ncbi:hypothetical protein F4779DRAFT_619740 [Xylariaceae sp. FL0662B]|nr:hypothetical protein F4779DRAFT_619740 [Xylariaceae sp. FL0662B]